MTVGIQQLDGLDNSKLTQLAQLPPNQRPGIIGLLPDKYEELERLAAVLDPAHTRLSYRTNSPKGGFSWHDYTPELWIADNVRNGRPLHDIVGKAAAHGHRPYVQGPNEVGGDDDPLVIKWHLRFAELIWEMGGVASIFAQAVGQLGQHHVDAWREAGVLSEAREGRLAINLREYGYVLPSEAIGPNQYAGRFVSRNAKIKAILRALPGDIEPDRIGSPGYPAHKVARYLMFPELRELRNANPHGIVIGEFGIDFDRDPRLPRKRNGELYRGYLDAGGLYQDALGWTVDRALLESMQLADRIYGDIPVMWFGAGKDPNWATHNLIPRWDVYLDYLRAVAKPAKPPPDPPIVVQPPDGERPPHPTPEPAPTGELSRLYAHPSFWEAVFESTELKKENVIAAIEAA